MAAHAPAAMTGAAARQAQGDGQAPCTRYRFADVAVDIGAHTVTRDGHPQPLEPKAFAVLEVLLEQPGQLAARDVLLDRVWGHRHVTPGVLTRVVAQLRQALGDDPQHPRLIATQHGLGYRFIGQVDSDARAPHPSPDPPPAAASLAAVQAAGADTAPAAASPLVDVPALATEPSAAPVPRTRHRHAAASLAVAMVAVLAWSGLRERDGPVAPVARPASVALLPFTAAPGEPSAFAQGLAQEMHDTLARVDGLSVAMSDIAGRDAVRAGRLLKVATALTADVRQDGDRVHISARLADTATGFTLWSRSYDRELGRAFETQAEIADEVTGVLLQALPRREAVAPRTPDGAASAAFLQGLARLQGRPQAQDVDQAERLFQQALAADTSFARAQAALCRAQVWRLEHVRDADALGRAQGACLRAQTMDPASAEATLALATLERIHGNDRQAQALYARAARDRALAADVQVGLAKLHAARGRTHAARDAFLAALRLRPHDAAIHREVGFWAYQAGQVPQAITAYAQAAALAPRDAQTWSSLAGLYMLLGDNAQAAHAFDRSVRIRPTPTALSNLGTLRYQAGDYARAAALYRQSLDLDDGDFQMWGFLGDALAADPATRVQARTPFQAAADRARDYLRINPRDARAQAALGWYEANLQRPRAARERIAQAQRLGTDAADVAWYGAQVAAVLQDRPALARHLRAARAAGLPDTMLDTNPFLRRGSVSAGAAPTDPPRNGDTQ